MDKNDALKKAIKSGDSAAICREFQRLYDENVRLVYRVLMDAFGKDDETDDDVQESFLALLNDPQRLLSVDRITDYWIQSAKYICGRRKQRQNLPMEESGAEVQSGDSSIPRLVDGKELFATVEECLGRPDADIVILRAAYDYSEREIATRLGMGEDAVHYRYKKGIKQLKRRLSDETEQN